MLLNELFLSLWFYVVFSAFAGIGLVFTLRIFPKNQILAYFAAKPLGLAIFGIIIWLLSSLKILSYQNNIFIIVFLIFLIIVGLFYSINTFRKILEPGERLKIFKNILILELVSIALYIGYLVLRSYNPAAYGTERFMDMMLVNASLKSETFPFIDAWYSGKLVNYYYYGHYLVSLLTKLTGLSSFLTYNFAIGLLYAVSFILPGLLVHEISKSKWCGVLAGFLVTTAGSLFYSSCVINSWLNGQSICSYASSTRLYTPSYIINEIPSYSFTVGDLHAHFLALPFFILNLVLIYQLVLSKQPKIGLSLSLLFTLVTSALINPSDLVSLAIVMTLLWLYKVYVLYKSSGAVKILLQNSEFRAWVYFAIFIVVGLFILYLPFLLNFKSPVLGFGLAFLFAQSHNFVFNGFQYPTPILALVGMWGVYLTVVGITYKYYRLIWNQQLFLVFITLTSVFLIIFVELFFVKDIYHIANPPYFRANTVFKFGYHTWVMLSIAFASFIGLIVLNNNIKPKFKSIGQVLLLIFSVLSLFYPYQAVKQFYLSSNVKVKTLNSAAFINNESADDFAIINWVNKNINKREIILEAVGDSYTYFSRISSFTGNISPMGWKSHQWTWRFDGKHAAELKKMDPQANIETGYGPIQAIANDVAKIYESENLFETRVVLNKYNIKYIVVGKLEKDTYLNINENKLKQLGKVVFSYNDSYIIKIY
jgi:uncharacterized membrane protein